MVFDPKSITRVVTAIGGLGTAAFGLVEAAKAIPLLSVNRIGFAGIKALVQKLTPGTAANSLSPEKIVATLQANWYNGTDLGSQKSIAKSLIKLNLNSGNATALAAETGVDPVILSQVAASIANGTALTQAQSDVYSRFDFILTALLDEKYQCSDNEYRNWTRFTAGIVTVGLAIAGGYAVDPQGTLLWPSILAGLLAVPLAPVAKDLSSALATAVNTMQLIKKPGAS